MKKTIMLFFVIAICIIGCGNAQKYDRPYYQRPYYPDHHYPPYYYRPYDPYYPRHYYRYHYYRRSCSNYMNNLCGSYPNSVWVRNGQETSFRKG